MRLVGCALNFQLMFGTLRKHSGILWGIIITVTIISFVIFFTPDIGRRAGRASADEVGTINGYPITQTDYQNAQREAIVQFGGEQQMRARGINFQQVTLERLVIQTKLREYNVQVSEKTLAAVITTMPSFRDRQTGVFRKDMYDAFIKRLALDQGVREEDFVRYLRAELGLQRLQELYGQSGKLVTSAEAEEYYRQANEQFAVELASFAPEDYLGKVQASGTNLSQFYSNRMALYRIPDRVVVNFVKFDFSNYLAQADADMAKITNLTAMIDAAYQQRGPAAFVDTNNVPLTPEKAKERIRTDERERLAAVAARKAANAFATELDNLEKKTPTSLVDLAIKKGLQVMESKPFAESDVPAGLQVMENFARQAFALGPDDVFKGPIPGADAYFVISLNRKLPSEIPPMENILQKVMDDYRAEETMRMARAAGEEFGAKVKAGLEAKKPFDKICAESKVTPRSLPTFSLSARFVEGLDRSVNLADIQETVQSLSPGQASKFVPSRDGGFVVYVRSRLPAAEDKLKEELPQVLAQLRRERQNQAFQEWARKSLETARITGQLASLSKAN